MCSFCGNDAVTSDQFHSKTGYAVNADLCESCKELTKNMTTDVYAEEFQDKIEEMAETLFGVY